MLNMRELQNAEHSEKMACLWKVLVVTPSINVKGREYLIYEK